MASVLDGVCVETTYDGGGAGPVTAITPRRSISGGGRGGRG